jgi:orotidine-5'-phosphate decarboxylase
VGRAARVLGRQGVAYCNFHAAGGVEMMRAAVDGLLTGASEAGHPAPVPIAVTVLTSDADVSAFGARLDAAIEADCGGVVCSLFEVERVHAARPDFITIVPGSRFTDSATNDQARFGTPGDAARKGSNVIVMGRPVSAADDRRAAAQRAHDEVANAITS